jgi:hypothetical protein
MTISKSKEAFARTLMGEVKSDLSRGKRYLYGYYDFLTTLYRPPNEAVISSLHYRYKMHFNRERSDLQALYVQAIPRIQKCSWLRE